MAQSLPKIAVTNWVEMNSLFSKIKNIISDVGSEFDIDLVKNTSNRVIGNSKIYVRHTYNDFEYLHFKVKRKK